MKKKILVTGATGFIGNHVIQALLQQDYNVIASSARFESAGGRSWFPRVKYIPLDLKDFDSNVNYYEYFDKPEAVIHLSWQGLPNYKAAFHIEENLPVHFDFLKNLIGHGLTDLTVTGTCFEYGMAEGCLREDLDTKPANAYAMAKDMLRTQLEHFWTENNFYFKWVRLFYMYGQGQSPNSLFSQLDKALANGDEVFNMSGGEQQRDYLPVEHVARYIVKIALQKEVTGIINCCSGKPVSVKVFVENYLKQQNKQIRLNLGYYSYPDYEPMSFWGDDKKLNTIK